jgi:hypothetical protein
VTRPGDPPTVGRFRGEEMRQVRLRYGARCRGCDRTINAGEECLTWRWKGAAVFAHRGCATTDKAIAGKVAR